MSFKSPNKWVDAILISAKVSLFLLSSKLERIPICAIPIITFKGVLISWLIIAKKSPFTAARYAFSCTSCFSDKRRLRKRLTIELILSERIENSSHVFNSTLVSRLSFVMESKQHIIYDIPLIICWFTTCSINNCIKITIKAIDIIIINKYTYTLEYTSFLNATAINE